MNVFMTGGTGVLGRPTVKALVASGHDVRVAVRSEERAPLVTSLGAKPVVVDLFDGKAVKAAVGGTEAVLHLATSIPPMSRMTFPSAWRTNDRLRGETTRHLIDAAHAHGVGTLIAESVTFMYPDGGEDWIDESVEWPPPHRRWEATYSLEELVREFAATGGTGIVLRFGLFYGPESRSVDEALRMARLRSSTLAGRADAYTASIHTDDAASAVVAALDAPSGTYNVVDDEPVTRRVYLDSFRDAFETAKLRIPPSAALRLAGGKGADILLRSQRVSNRRFKETVSWSPTYPSVRAGWPAVARARSEAV